MLFNKKINILIILLIMILLFSINPSYATTLNDSLYVWPNSFDSIETISSSNQNFSLNLESQAAILIEQKTGKVLYEHNCHEQLRPASVTKLMSILLIMEAIDNGSISLNDSVSCSEHASSMGGSQIWLDQTETLTVHEMLKAICVVSANDCCVAMAEYISGSEESFVALMNNKAKELGMNDTHFINCHGIDEDGHVTSAYDIALMSKELLTKHPSITNYTTIWMDSLRDNKSELVNTNKLVKNYQGCTGLKTGSTSLALYNLSASATRDNLSLIAVIMKAPSTKIRFKEASSLLNYGFSNYSFKQFGNKGDIIKTINVSKGTSSSINGILEETTGTIINKNEEKNLEQIISINNSVSAPINKGQKLGELSYKLNNETIASVNIVAENEVKNLTYFSTSIKLINNWFNLLR